MAVGRNTAIIAGSVLAPTVLALGGGVSEVSYASTMGLAISLDALIGNQNSSLRTMAYIGALYNVISALRGDPIGQIAGTGMTCIAAAAHLFFGRAAEVRDAEAGLHAHRH